MRKREETVSAIESAKNGAQEKQIFIREILLVLLDIRDLLALHAPEVREKS